MTKEELAAKLKDGRVPGFKFFDKASNVEMMLKYQHPKQNWIFYKNPDGKWIPLRKATEEDLREMSVAVSKAHHAE